MKSLKFFSCGCGRRNTTWKLAAGSWQPRKVAPNDTVCFHCQQAAEKYLKALLTFLSIQAPRTHDLPELAALLPSDLLPDALTSQLALMNPYTVDVRYADDMREPQMADALRASEIAGAVRAEV